MTSLMLAVMALPERNTFAQALLFLGYIYNDTLNLLLEVGASSPLYHLVWSLHQPCRHAKTADVVVCTTALLLLGEIMCICAMAGEFTVADIATQQAFVPNKATTLSSKSIARLVKAFPLAQAFNDAFWILVIVTNVLLIITIASVTVTISAIFLIRQKGTISPICEDIFGNLAMGLAGIIPTGMTILVGLGKTSQHTCPVQMGMGEWYPLYNLHPGWQWWMWYHIMM
ncbi:hypothetical protein GLOTRDRAFT_94782 [Gloeophyllum trabeum ATCC 11539]|uniref:Uncharacterized protein n=1 Tax=Gloeophyllum trabeum (strain ATCC 11539 / FP-39264 / Madison 617) TaxID=670483 RepID=S7Q1Z3_GLOTA|nr:uncharacterized protein GLOTRDRAFT_94782 [Gloeophyllum trabeum ATCC 11539]EPQ53563.1 hypothetical protein GLOTRDRAFT_94782 [Gloeophyllum trabeum ATCC 11539]